MTHGYYSPDGSFGQSRWAHCTLAGRIARAAVLAGCVLFACAAERGGEGALLDGLSRFAEGGYAEALGDWIDAADQGNADGALYAGVLYDTGQGIPRDPAEALYWYKRGAALGSATATFNVGVMYDAGVGMASRADQAAVWYAAAAKLGIARADYNLGLLTEAGIGVPRDRARAARLFAAAARLGVSAGKAHLPKQDAERGEGVVAPPGRSDVAMQDFAHAQQALLGRSSARVAKAAALFRHAADLGDALAQYDLGYCYDNGIGVERDLARAEQWYRRAASGATQPQLRTIATAARDAVRAKLTATDSPMVPASAASIHPGGPER